MYKRWNESTFLHIIEITDRNMTSLMFLDMVKSTWTKAQTKHKKERPVSIIGTQCARLECIVVELCCNRIPLSNTKCIPY